MMEVVKAVKARMVTVEKCMVGSVVEEGNVA